MLDEFSVRTVLDRHLGGVEAPEELWQRVRFAKSAKPPVRSFAWALATAAAVLVIGLVTLNLHRSLPELRSSSGSEVRSWVQRQCGLDIPLAERATSPVRLEGAQLIAGGVSTAAVKFYAGDHVATLLVTREPSGDSFETHRRTGAASWAMRGQTYTVVSSTPGDLQAACLLCHAGEGGL